MARAIIGVVDTEFFDYQEPESATYDPAIPAGKDLADFIIQRLVLSGVDCPTRAFDGEGGWTFHVELAGILYLVFVHWAPIGPKSANRWVIQPDISKSIVRALFGRRTADEDIAPIVHALQQALAGAREIGKLEWITRDKFNEIY
jgi:hypothetical protein